MNDPKRVPVVRVDDDDVTFDPTRWPPCAKPFGFWPTNLADCDRPYGHTGGHTREGILWRGQRDEEDEIRTRSVMHRWCPVTENDQRAATDRDQG